MSLSLRTKQVAGVTMIVALTLVPLSMWHLATVARMLLEQNQRQAELLAKVIYQRVYDVVLASGDNPAAGLRSDTGLRSILQGSLYSPNSQYAAIVDTGGIVIASSDDKMERIAPAKELQQVLDAGWIAQWRAISTPQSFEARMPLFIDTVEFGSIRVGFSTFLILDDFRTSLRRTAATTAGGLIAAAIIAAFLAGLVVRPIHVIQSGLARLGRGELDVAVDLPQASDLGDLGASFRAVSARLAADRTEIAGQRAALETVVEHLEDAVALFAPDRTLLFANPAMRASLSADHGSIDQVLPAGHPFRAAVETTLGTREPFGPQTVQAPDGGERLVLAHDVADDEHGRLGVLLVARNLTYLSQVQSTLAYSRKLAALGRLSAGIAHEVKNPLNATMIHLELLKMQLVDQPAAKEHLSVIAAQVRRLDEVVQGFLKFTRPEELKLQPVPIRPLLDAIMPVIHAEAESVGIDVRVECPEDLPPVSGDSGMLEQAFLNLGLNACQAMRNGGRLRIAATTRPRSRVEIMFEDTGVGIPPENLARIFDLYFTTKDQGSGIGLSLVYRTIQLHDGEIEVQSTPGRGTTFRVLLHQG